MALSEASLLPSDLHYSLCMQPLSCLNATEAAQGPVPTEHKHLICPVMMVPQMRQDCDPIPRPCLVVTVGRGAVTLGSKMGWEEEKQNRNGIAMVAIL